MKAFRFLLLPVFLLLPIVQLQAQGIEKRVALAPISYAPGSNARVHAEQLYNHIITTFHQTQRVKVIDNLFAHDLISQEKDVQSGEDYVEGHVIEKGKSEGADYILFVHVNTIKAYPQKDKNEEMLGYDANITLFVRLFNVKTRITESTDKITPEGITDIIGYDELMKEGERQAKRGLLDKLNGKQFPSTEQEAIDRAMGELEPHVRSFVNKAFPLEMRVANILQDKGSRKEKFEVWIKGGKSLGLKKGDKLTVRYEYTQKIDEETTAINFSNIGKLKVIKHSADGGFVICHFTTGEKEIRTKFQEDKNSLRVTPDLKGFKLFGK